MKFGLIFMHQYEKETFSSGKLKDLACIGNTYF
jgi:hypothetical protein